MPSPSAKGLCGGELHPVHPPFPSSKLCRNLECRGERTSKTNVHDRKLLVRWGLQKDVQVLLPIDLGGDNPSGFCGLRGRRPHADADGCAHRTSGHSCADGCAHSHYGAYCDAGSHCHRGSHANARSRPDGHSVSQCHGGSGPYASPRADGVGNVGWRGQRVCPVAL